MKKLLFIGCGDIGIALANRLETQWHCVGVRRNTAALPDNIEGIAADLTAPSSLAQLKNLSADAVVITLTPLEFSKAGYRAIFVDGLKSLIPILEAINPERVLFASSTSVYHQRDSELVDEDSPTQPSSFSGQAVLAAEELLKSSELPATLVRFGGIYGPGRTRLIERVLSGRCTPADQDRFSNRVHRDDCVGVFDHLLTLTKPTELYVATDGNAVLQSDVERWLASRLGVHYAQEASEPATKSRTGSKRCNNRRLVQSGYSFIHPDFTSGYDSVIKGLALER